MTIDSENVSNEPATAQDRFSGGVTAYRQGRRESALGAADDEMPLPTRLPGRARGIEPTGDVDRAAPLPSLDRHGLARPAFGGWGGTGRSASMADHPLLRGLLHELPARGAMPASDWLDRWFEAARSILELLYVQEAGKK
jgi:hypothetical protein